MTRATGTQANMNAKQLIEQVVNGADPNSLIGRMIPRTHESRNRRSRMELKVLSDASYSGDDYWSVGFYADSAGIVSHYGTSANIATKTDAQKAEARPKALEIFRSVGLAVNSDQLGGLGYDDWNVDISATAEEASQIAINFKNTHPGLAGSIQHMSHDDLHPDSQMFEFGDIYAYV